MIKYFLGLLICMCFFSAKAQDTIRLKSYPSSSVWKANGFFVCWDENCHSCWAEKQVKNGIYVLMYNNDLVAKYKKISKNEHIIYYYADSIVHSIEYYPYFKIKLSENKNYYSVREIVSYSKKYELIFNSAMNDFQIIFRKVNQHEKYSIDFDVYNSPRLR